MEETVLLYNIDKTQAGKAIISILEKLNVKIRGFDRGADMGKEDLWMMYIGICLILKVK